MLFHRLHSLDNSLTTHVWLTGCAYV
jgi:hypothetical protein